MRITNYVNEEKRTCVVVIDQTELDVIHRIKRLIRLADPQGNFIFFGERSYLNGPFRGKARAHPADTFVEETGLEIARQRAMRLYKRAWNREIVYLMGALENITNALEGEIDYTVLDWEPEPFHMEVDPQRAPPPDNFPRSIGGPRESDD